ncbi:protein DMP2-like [Juglans microcarpa x Juglans regia]|uniref:protein DMP2-like n=1 Tax=Juglans microcarpa x Juglans regia TaxID=2249226 RepID=UPI001B7DC625|nr:protein DMP2-like [Juglans microcarpa x Juglans regia]
MDASKSTESSGQKTMKDHTFSGLGNLVRLLPTGTVFTYQFLSPALSNYGNCNTFKYKFPTSILVGLCGLACFFSTFTDSYVGDDKKTHYGIATWKGIWPSSESKNVDLSAYKLRFADFVHAFFAVAVFGVVVLLDQNTVECFYPVSASTEKTLLKVLPPVVGAVSSVVFMAFPNKRHGIGYPKSTSTESSKDSKSSTSTTGAVSSTTEV